MKTHLEDRKDDPAVHGARRWDAAISTKLLCPALIRVVVHRPVEAYQAMKLSERDYKWSSLLTHAIIVVTRVVYLKSRYRICGLDHQ